MNDELEREATVSDRLARTALEQYFNSIEKPFQETLEGLQREQRSLAVFGVIYALCAIPVIPYVAYKTASRMLGSRIVEFRGFHLSLSSFWFWWIALFFATLAILILAMKVLHPSKKEKKRWLSPPQMRFAYCYGMAHEIRSYLTNRRDIHLVTAQKYVKSIAMAMKGSGTIAFEGGVYPYWQPDIIGAVEGLEVPHSAWLRAASPRWYRLQPDTEQILRAFNHFLSKSSDRLRDRKDVIAIESAATDLAKYLYTEIPEFSDSKPQSSFERAGIDALLRFARQINELPAYRSETASSTPKERLSGRLLAVGRKLSWPFVQENLLLSFLSWYALFLGLFAVGLYSAFRYVQSLRMDSTLVAMLVGGPIATAITAATLPRLTKSK